MKVLLFVQTGDARPTRFKNFTAHQQDDGWLDFAKGYAEGVECDRWWLVECMDAEHGRGIISHVVKHGEDAVQPAVGRILASGGCA